MIYFGMVTAGMSVDLGRPEGFEGEVVGDYRWKCDDMTGECSLQASYLQGNDSAPSSGLGTAGDLTGGVDCAQRIKLGGDLATGGQPAGPLPSGAEVSLSTFPEDDSHNIRMHPLAKLYPTGQVSLCTPKVQSAFEESGVPVVGCGFEQNCVGTYPDQLPPASRPYLTAACTVDWSQEHTDTLLRLVQQGQDVSPGHYPYAVPDLLEALDTVPLDRNNVMVAGSVSPWLEATLAANGAGKIYTMDYDFRDLKTNLTQLVLRKDLEGQRSVYGAIVSFSSIEHDGLGRYCDPVNPDGDRAAMVEFYQWLQPGGILYLGIPVGEKTHVEGNGHRIYGSDRFAKLIKGFKLLHTVTTHWGQEPWRGSAWNNQPWFVLQREE